jgi:ABC-type glycerol-3-phosphate transport system permease component
MVGTILAMLPMLAVHIILQKHFTEEISASGMKL